VHRHGVGFALHAHHRREPLPKAGRALCLGIVLPGASAKPYTFIEGNQARVAGPASPDQVFRLAVLLVGRLRDRFRRCAAAAECTDVGAVEKVIEEFRARKRPGRER
jgi:hypothetical protein